MEWWTPQSSPPPGTGPGAGWGMSATLLLVFGWDSAKQELVKASDHQGIVFSDVMRPDWAARLRDERLKTTSLFRSGESWQWWGMWCSRRWQKTEIRMGFVYLKKKNKERVNCIHGHSTFRICPPWSLNFNFVRRSLNFWFLSNTTITLAGF